MAFRIDIEKIIDGAVTTIQAGMAAQVALINGETSDFDIAAPPAANYHKARKVIVPQYPAIIVFAALTDLEDYYAGEARAAEYLFGISFLHTGPDGTEENKEKYCQRMARAIDQIILATPSMGVASIEYTYTDKIGFNEYPHSDGRIIKSADLSMRASESTEDLS